MKLNIIIFFFLILFLPLSLRASYTSADCIKCHALKDGDSSLRISLQEYKNSVHGGVATCMDCHNTVLNEAHMTEGARAVNCSQCHPAESGERDYFSFLPTLRVKWHAKADFSGNYSSKNCIGCHQGKASHGQKEPVDNQNCYVSYEDERKFYNGKYSSHSRQRKTAGDFCIGCYLSDIYCCYITGFNRIYS